MSLSDGEKPRTWGAVYAGGVTMSLASVEGEQNPHWTEADEAAYLERVRKKAAEMAAAIVEEARGEADALRETARNEGYNQGMAQAGQEMEEFQTAVGESVSAVLGAIEGQCSAIFAAWREDLVTLLRIAAEKAVGMPLTDDRARLLEEVYIGSVTALENRRNLVIHVNPEDEPAIADIVAMTQARFPDLKAWSVKGDASMAAGGLMVESDDSLADNRLEKRAALVNEMLRNVTLPQG